MLALDGEKRRVDAVTSNPGHLLWSGIVPRSRAKAVADRLLREDLFSGWGIRCLSSEMRGYNPLEYHAGTVWPHDTAICAEGMRRYGLRRHAARLCHAIVDAAVAFEDRLPEVFAGFARDGTNVPVPTPTRSPRKPGRRERRCSPCGHCSVSTWSTAGCGRSRAFRGSSDGSVCDGSRSAAGAWTRRRKEPAASQNGRLLRSGAISLYRTTIYLYRPPLRLNSPRRARK